MYSRLLQSMQLHEFLSEKISQKKERKKEKKESDNLMD